MSSQTDRHDDSAALRARLTEAEETLRAIRHGEIDALAIESPGGTRVYTLHSADEPYRALVEQMQEGALVLTGRGDILYSNNAFAALMGVPLESVAGSHIDRFMTASDRGAFQTMLNAGSGRRRSSLIGAGAAPVEVSLSLTTTSPGGDRINLIVTDLTALLEASTGRDRAERESRSKNDFLAMLSHELRNPLGAISAAVRLLQVAGAAAPGVTAPWVVRAHEVIARQVSHITGLINDLLDVERVVSGKIRLDRQPLDMAVIVQQAVATVTADARLHREIEITTDTVWVEGDPLRLEQVVTNLVTNAIKYTPPGGRIQVGLCAEGDDAVLIVDDAGVGISAGLLPYVFDLYVQADRTLDRAQGGLGIGLSLCRRLVELHGGTVSAVSAGEGQGSCFTVRLKRGLRSPSRARRSSRFHPARRPHDACAIEHRRAGALLPRWSG